MLMPGKVKFRKQQRGRRCGKAMTGSTVAFGDYGLKTLEDGWITAREIEASRIAITRFVKRGGKIWVRLFPDKPITKKAAETPHGKGKGRARSVGRRGQAGEGPVRDGGRGRKDRARGDAPRVPQALGEDEIRRASSAIGSKRCRSDGKTLVKYRGMEPEVLAKEEAELRTAIWKMKLQKGTGQITDPLRLAVIKRDLARLLTVHRERETVRTTGKRS